jgi:hypothetical protein
MTRTRLRQLWIRSYGGPVWTLPVFIGCLLVTGYVADKIVEGPMAFRIIVWFAAAAVLHDFVLFPAYTLLDRATGAIRLPRSAGLHSAINYVRVPAALSLLMLLIFAPTIVGRGSRAFYAASGLGRIDVFVRWVLLSLAFFVISGAVYLIRFLLSRHSTKERT